MQIKSTQLRPTNDKDKFYNDFTFNTGLETLAFWRSLQNIPYQNKWLDVQAKRVTILVEVV